MLTLEWEQTLGINVGWGKGLEIEKVHRIVRATLTC